MPKGMFVDASDGGILTLNTDMSRRVTKERDNSFLMNCRRTKKQFDFVSGPHSNEDDEPIDKNHNRTIKVSHSDEFTNYKNLVYDSNNGYFVENIPDMSRVS